MNHEPSNRCHLPICHPAPASLPVVRQACEDPAPDTLIGRMVSWNGLQLGHVAVAGVDLAARARVGGWLTRVS